MATAKKQPTRFKVGGQTYTLLEIDDLEFREVEFIEENCGGDPVETIDFRRKAALRALFFVSMQRAGSDVDFDDLGEMKFSDIEKVEEDSEPTPKRPTGRSRSKPTPEPSE